MTQEFISMAEASKLTGYDQEYLGLLSRQGKIRSKKVGKKWYTTVDHLNDYLEEKKPNEVIEKSKLNLGGRRGKNSKTFAVVLFLIFATLVLWAYDTVSQKFSNLENKTNQNIFIPEETVRIPNEKGGFDVYGTGRVKMGEENLLP